MFYLNAAQERNQQQKLFRLASALWEGCTWWNPVGVLLTVAATIHTVVCVGHILCPQHPGYWWHELQQLHSNTVSHLDVSAFLCTLHNSVPMPVTHVEHKTLVLAENWGMWWHWQFWLDTGQMGRYDTKLLLWAKLTDIKECLLYYHSNVGRPVRIQSTKSWYCDKRMGASTLCQQSLHAAFARELVTTWAFLEHC